ncbi:hypothetical protein BG015_008696 [Linnemannia schmuckeri]|uniref:FAD-binding domain-containing protein n=1 Tax=Linnemannia schmuckeri TaxID=64567 RepID=A0A9P5VEW2_9FUNG|nr:hypothetical protein BG015_008696 [Linnemannia schmuckeri]
MSLPPRAYPRVIIVGGGLGGLMLAILLDKMGVPYHIFERAPKVKPLGALMSLNGNILALFDQLGMLEDIMKVSLVSLNSSLYTEKMEKITEIDVRTHYEYTGYQFLMFPRPDLFAILLSRIPPDRINNTCYEGDIIVGADGVYSAVRHNMFREMREQQEQEVHYYGGSSIVIPPSDTKDFAIPYLCMVGVTKPLDSNKYPVLRHPNTQLHHVIGENTPYSWTVITIPRNRFCWSVMVQVKDQAEAKEQRFMNSEWGPEANEKLIDIVRDFPVTFGGKLGEIIEATPKSGVSKVMLEEKLFETWYHGGIVLIGDGAMNAMQDAVILANCIYDLENLRSESLTAAFRDYKEQRYSHAKRQIFNSRLNAKLSSGQTRTERLVRHIVLNLLPRSIQNKQFSKDAAYRPQCTFLPRIPDKGSVPSLPQKPSRRYQAEMRAAAAAAAAEEMMRRESKVDLYCASSMNSNACLVPKGA